jgi:hypothetical protein
MAGCYSGGQNWISEGNRNSARGAARDLCNYGVLAGWFNSPGYTKTACANLGNGIRVDFAVGWRGSGGYTLNSGDCEYRLTNEINGCGNGGESTIADWFFK